ncbi:hypothetical protein FA15DRAFT_673298 [Coprinopsis marcescibilis]|uniref:DUF6593 domain-containing protein n=1 Tax=Coprinopsis marcescibilis TaxID=230819 RepID=A0A5C3KL33_COPMA|nr:hypothetical protein FA15DRAFT_673298 [Coprinopsis marcescibilis]
MLPPAATGFRMLKLVRQRQAVALAIRSSPTYVVCHTNYISFILKCNMRDPFVLVLSPDNPCNTTITDRDTGKTLYTVWTEHLKDSYTRVKDAHGQEIAYWKWRNIRSDLLTMKSGTGTDTTAPAADWLRPSMIPFNHTVYFSDQQKRKYRWNGVAAGEILELCTQEDKKHPIARFKKAYRYNSIKQTPSVMVYDPATLTLTGRAQEIMDMVVISFCLLEKDRRMDEVSAKNQAEASAIPVVPLAL